MRYTRRISLSVYESNKDYVEIEFNSDEVETEFMLTLRRRQSTTCPAIAWAAMTRDEVIALRDCLTTLLSDTTFSPTPT